MAIFDKFMDLIRDDDDDDDYDPDEYDAYQEQEAKKAEKKRLKEQKAAEAAARKREREEQEADMPKSEKKSGGFLNKIKSILSDSDDEDYDDEYEEYLNENGDDRDTYNSGYSSRPTQTESRRSYSSNRSVLPTNNYKHASSRSQSYSQQAATGKTANFNVNKEEVRPQNRASLSGRETAFPQRVQNHNVSSMAVNIIKPTSFEDCQDICDTLLNGKPIIVNLEGFDLSLAQRVMDFVSGCVYSINGKLHQISGYVFIISPDGVDVSGDYLALMKEDGFGVPTFNR